MATWQTALRSRLKADPGVAAICKEIHWTVRPQGTGYPAIVLTLVDDQRPQHYRGFHSARLSRVQIDCMALTALQCSALTEAVVAAVAGPFTQEGIEFQRTQFETTVSRGASDGAQFVHREQTDIIVWH